MKTSVYIATSLDGFIARENGDLDWLPGSQEGERDGSETTAEDFGYQEFIDTVDVIIMGRNTYEFVHSTGQWPYGDRRFILLSRKLSQDSDNLLDGVEVKSGSLTELIEELRQSGARHIYVDGGKTIQGFLNAGLIQEMIITTIPVLIGRGIPLFGPLNKDLQLQHIETRSFTNGFVQSKYMILN